MYTVDIVCGVALFSILIYFLNSIRKLKKPADDGTAELKFTLNLLIQNLKETENRLKNEFSLNRSETLQNSKDLREEVSKHLNTFTQVFSTQLNQLTKSLEEKLTIFQNGFDDNSKENRTQLKQNLDDFKTGLNAALKDYKESMRDNFSDFSTQQQASTSANNERLLDVKNTLEKSVKSLQDNNEKKLEEMRNTVDEKLQKTLETRLTQSFELVSKNLESVQKGIGEMQQLAIGFGDIKKVLSNVKTRGVLGEYQLENILEQLLTPDQYSKNVRPKPSSTGIVEFAVKLPGKSNKENIVWLPIDSKFPKEDFEQLLNAYDHGSSEDIDECRKTFVKGIKKCAGDICSRYIDPPNTTDFAILFLPFESLYSEVLRTPGLFESIQRECRIIITGPTTLSAILSSLQMGFRTLAIEKRSSEVWNLLAAVKTEFGTFGGILDKTKKKLEEATNVIDQAGVRSRAIERKLKDVQSLPPGSINVIEDVTDIVVDEIEIGGKPILYE
jgi:DNA recombination protein RmuC